MYSLPPGEYMVLSAPEPIMCEICECLRRKVALNNEPVFTINGEILGIEGMSRFEVCGHDVPRCSVDADGLAMMMDAYERGAQVELSSRWEDYED